MSAQPKVLAENEEAGRRPVTGDPQSGTPVEEESRMSQNVAPRLSRARMLCKVAALVADGFPAPHHIDLRQHEERALLGLDFDSRVDMRRWADVIGVTPDNWREQPYQFQGGPHQVLANAHVESWHGWWTALSATDPIEEAAAESDEIARVRAYAEGEATS